MGLQILMVINLIITGLLPHQSFITGELRNAKFSDNYRDLIDLFETVLSTHQPTWDNCQLLLNILSAIGEWTYYFKSTQKCPRHCRSPNYFPYKGPNWDYNMAAGRIHLLVYQQALLASLKVATKWHTNLAMVYDVR